MTIAYTIEGADKNTGKERTVNVSAADQKSAEHYANQQGIMVERIYATPDPQNKGILTKIIPSLSTRLAWCSVMMKVIAVCVLVYSLDSCKPTNHFDISRGEYLYSYDHEPDTSQYGTPATFKFDSSLDKYNREQILLHDTARENISAPIEFFTACVLFFGSFGITALSRLTKEPT